MIKKPEHPFDELMLAPERDIRLAAAALMFARDAYPNLKAAEYLSRLDFLAGEIDRVDARDPLDRIEAINRVIAEREGFSGNLDDFYDPRNSYLNEVLRRHVGIPISLSAIWLDVAGQLDWPIVGVNFPGHFLIRYETGEGDLYIDPFHNGVLVTEVNLQDRLEEHLGPQAVFQREHVMPVGPKMILMRMLGNLRNIYLMNAEWSAAEQVLARQLAILPDAADAWFHRGVAFTEMSRFVDAIRCFEQSLDLVGQHKDAEIIKRHLKVARQGLASTN